MRRFPKKEAEIAGLAERLWRGLLDNNAIFSQPPVHPILIRFKKIIYQSRHDNFLAAQAAAEQATADKDQALEELIEAMKADIRYAENTVNYDDDKLKLIFLQKSVDFAAKAVYFVAAHAEKRLTRFSLWLHTLGRGKTDLVCG